MIRYFNVRHTEVSRFTFNKNARYICHLSERARTLAGKSQLAIDHCNFLQLSKILDHQMQ